MRPMIRGSRRRGVSLVELMVSIGLLAFISAFTGFLLVMTVRSTYGIHRQVRGQLAAASAAERATTLLRSAVYFSMWPGDEAFSPPLLTRMRFAVPGAGNSVTTQVLCFNPAKGTLEFYENENQVSFSVSPDGFVPVGTPARRFAHLSEMKFHWESEYRLTLIFNYEYSGYALQGPGTGRKLYGRFITDVIARRHFMDQGVESYAEADVATSSPATL